MVHSRLELLAFYQRGLGDKVVTLPNIKYDQYEKAVARSCFVVIEKLSYSNQLLIFLSLPIEHLRQNCEANLSGIKLILDLMEVVDRLKDSLRSRR